MPAWHQPIRFPRRVHVPSPFRVAFRRICLPEPPTGLDRLIHQDGWPSLLCHSITQTSLASTGIFNLFPIIYALRPRLRGRLTLRGRTFPRKPWDFGGKDSHLTFRYSCPHNHFHTVHARFPSRFDPVWNAPLPLAVPEGTTNPQLRQPVLVPIIFGAGSLD